MLMGTTKGATIGVDLGRKRDSTAIVVAERGGDDVVRVKAIRELRNVPFEAQVEEIRGLVRTYDPFAVNVDETGLGLPIVERLQRQVGHRVRGLTFTAGSKEELVARTVALLQDRKLKFGVHPRLREQLHSIRRDVTRDGRILYRVDESSDLTGEHHGDLAWALMLAVYGHRVERGHAGPVRPPPQFRGGLAGMLDRQAAARVVGLPRARDRPLCNTCGEPIPAGQIQWIPSSGARVHAGPCGPGRPRVRVSAPDGE
jgi:phage FluMu gp28-like protein